MAAARDVPGLDGREPFRAAAARVVSVRSQELWDHSEDVLDTEDIERVHDMRVATRRLRAVLEIFAPCFPPKSHRRALREVKRLADALGERRDPDVQILSLASYAEQVPMPDRPGLDLLIARLRSEQAGANARLAEALAKVERSGLRARLASLVQEAER